jgi:chromosome segregation ATPase
MTFRRFHEARPLSFNLIACIFVSLTTVIATSMFLARCKQSNDGFDFAALADERAASVMEEHIKSRDAVISRADSRIKEQELLLEELRERHVQLQQELERARTRDGKLESDINNLKRAREQKTAQIDNMNIRGLSDELERLGY